MATSASCRYVASAPEVSNLSLFPTPPIPGVATKRRVLVVENHRFFRENLVNWLADQEELECCGQAETVSEAQDAVNSGHPDLVLLDLFLDQDSHGFDFLRWMEATLLQLPVIVLSQHEESEFAYSALDAGARAYVSKAAATEELHPAISAVFDGKSYISGLGAFPSTT